MSNLVTSLIITVIGMGLVFVAILLLWGLMEIIVQATAKAEVQEEEQAESPALSTASSEESPAQSLKQKAAAVAVAFALAIRQATPSTASAVPERVLSAWQANALAVRVNQRVAVMQRRVKA